ncbi:MAG: extracellular solute-binding protein [Alphaproteobacteria bacterium]|nr:extracellular solute-binding protein [Alphaproteobacteria bacterium]
MADQVQLRGMTWDHSRGFDPMVATSQAFGERHPGVAIHWEKRSLQAFADRPIEDMADSYDLMVIDHPHVGEVARTGHLMALDGLGRDDELAALANQSVGVSHRSYEFDGRQWALAIDAATPVAAFRADRIETAPKSWSEVLTLARAGEVAVALVPVNCLTNFFGLARNLDFTVAEHPDQLIARNEGHQVLELMRELFLHVDPRCLSLDPIGVLDWMGRSADGPAYSPFGYGYTNYSRDGYCRFPITFADAPGIDKNGPRGTVIGGTGIAISSTTEHRDIAVDYAFWVAGAKCQSGLFFEAGGQPGNAVAWEDDACNAASRDFFRNTRRTMESAWLRPRYDGYMRLQDAAGNIIHQFLRNEFDIETALDRLQQSYLESRS